MLVKRRHKVNKAETGALVNDTGSFQFLVAV